MGINWFLVFKWKFYLQQYLSKKNIHGCFCLLFSNGRDFLKVDRSLREEDYCCDRFFPRHFIFVLKWRKPGRLFFYILVCLSVRCEWSFRTSSFVEKIIVCYCKDLYGFNFIIVVRNAFSDVPCYFALDLSYNIYFVVGNYSPTGFL